MNQLSPTENICNLGGPHDAFAVGIGSKEHYLIHPHLEAFPWTMEQASE